MLLILTKMQCGISIWAGFQITLSTVQREDRTVLLHTVDRTILKYSVYTFSMPTSSQEWAWENRGAHQLVHGDLKNGSTRYWNYLEEYWPCAGGLSAVSAIGTQLRDPINSGLARWRVTVSINKWTPRGNRAEYRE